MVGGICCLFSVVGAFYYLRIVKVILFDGMCIDDSVKKFRLVLCLQPSGH